MDSAAGDDYWSTVQCRYENRWGLPDTIDMEASNERLDVIKWLHANRTEGCMSSAMNKAAKYGHLDIVK